VARQPSGLQTIRSEGGLLPPDLLRRVLEPKEKLEGTQPEDYGLPKGERINEVITQSWNRLRKHWAEFRSAAANLPDGEAGTGITNERWNLPLLRELGFGLLPTSAGPEINGRIYAINRFFGPVPVHLIGSSLSLDHRAAGVRGAAVNPHGLVQEFLNRSAAHLWAILSNGLRFRILRKNQALSRQSFIEFDLEAMFAGEVYSDFVLLWLTSHATRFAPRDGDRPDSCWLEKWTKIADEQGTRALGDLRGGVERALLILGEGFTAHPKNVDLRDGLRSGAVSLADFHGQLLRVVYRIIFLFVAEDRTIDGQSLLHPLDSSEPAKLARDRYASHYSMARFRDLAATIKGSRHTDLWRQFQLLVGALAGDAGSAAVREHLALPTLGSFLWDPGFTSALNAAELTNHDFLEALRHLAFTRQGKALRPVDYKNLGAEELGGVYESLLALTPQISADGARFTFAEFTGSERKTSGSYYTPDSLVQCLLDSALDPVVEDAIQGKNGREAERAILALKVCDPAVGSGHFLVGAAHRLARHLARVRAQSEGESEPSPLLYQHALRDVIGRCLYGVDLSPMAAELCRVSLWLEALEPGKPLSFLDHHIRVGNSLLGATPELIAAGIPDEAFSAIEGDDKKACAALKKRNKAQRSHPPGPLFAQQDAEAQALLERASAALEELPDDRPEAIRLKELAFRRHEQTQEYRQKKQLADAWCAAFVIRKRFDEPGRESSAVGIIQGHLNGLAEGRLLPAEIDSEVRSLSSQYQFFHWHLAFPEVFARSGFDCVLGNPPWERVQFEERAYFAERRPEIYGESNQSRRRSMIERLANEAPDLYATWEKSRRQADAEAHILRSSGRYPLSAFDKFNVYAVFLELSAQLYATRGRVGIIVKAGFITDSLCSTLFSTLMKKRMVSQVFEFENRAKLFEDVHPQERFALVCLSHQVEATDFCFDNQLISDIREADRHVPISYEDVRRLSPNTASCPKFPSQRAYLIVQRCYAEFAPLKRHTPSESPWGISIDRYINISDFSDEILLSSQVDRTNIEASVSGTQYLPLYEGKLFHQFDHRFATYTQILPEPASVQLTDKSPMNDVSFCRYIPETIAARRNPRLRTLSAFVAARDITNRTNERGVIAAIIPACITDYTVRVLQLTPSTAERQLFMSALLNSYVFDYLARQRIGGTHLNNDILEQLPVPVFGNHPEETTFVVPRALELTYTAWNLEPFARDCNCFGPPFRWDEERRFLLRCELDAIFFHLYLAPDACGDWRPTETPEDLARLKAGFPTPRDAIDYILETFPIVRRKDIEQYGDYRTKLVILDIYDSMLRANTSGQSYQTLLNPPPADPQVTHPQLRGGR
jgi:hypothetical protein